MAVRFGLITALLILLVGAVFTNPTIDQYRAALPVPEQKVGFVGALVGAIDQIAYYADISVRNMYVCTVFNGPGNRRAVGMFNRFLVLQY